MLSVGSVIRRKVRPSESASSDQKRPRKKPLGIAIGKENISGADIPGDSTDSKEYMQLIKERQSLQKQLDKMKESLESNKVELHKLTEAFRMEQLQNRQLAQANSHLLEELNCGRDRLKAIQHELACTRAMLKAKCYEFNLQGTAAHLNVANKDKKPIKSPEGAAEEQRPLPGESTDTSQETSSGFTADAVQVTDKKKKGNNRRKLVRRSCILRGRPQCEPIGELFELKDVQFPIRSQRKAEPPPTEDSSHPTTVVVFQDASPPPPSGSELPSAPETQCKDEHEHLEQGVFAFSANRVSADNSSSPPAAVAAPVDHQQAPQSLTGGRPARRAKVGVSYRELPLNIKMRREN